MCFSDWKDRVVIGVNFWGRRVVDGVEREKRVERII